MLGADFKTLRFIARNATGELGCYDLDSGLRLRRTNDPAGLAWTARRWRCPNHSSRSEAGAALYVDAQGKTLAAAQRRPGARPAGTVGRWARLPRSVHRAQPAQRHGTFYELPAENAGGFIKLRPIARTTGDYRLRQLARVLVISGPR